MNQGPERNTSTDVADLLRAFALRFLVIGLVLAVTGATMLGLVALLAGAGLLHLSPSDRGAAPWISPGGAGAERGRPG
ncbi:hypothetical protein [Saccharopolyspora oryzae]|uniref:Uncharacterized protein n=1 Tax=Saccharopolyspora oryzae TaxID=2997343 RepID=A0ABT4V713_9PSEU|nr:hypothetical protein [Saccharopolyspora oryzae]MDA3629749.1 hypothetical protein [Saccharopolyspora oryzae]